MINSINDLLIRSAKLDSSLGEFLLLKPYDDSERLLSSRIMCGVAFEHAESVKILTGSGNFTSALGLLRLQYEAMVRAMWLLYAAKESSISKLTAELNYENSKKADKIPMLAEMLADMEGKAPQEALNMLLEFKEYSWKPLSSYVHGGIHALSRHSKGYPVPLLMQALRASNGVLIMAGMLLVILSGDQNQMGKIPKIQIEYADCLPELKRTES